VDLEPVDPGVVPEFLAEHLPEKAQEFWRTVAPDLVATDRLHTEDVPVFVQLCMAYHFSLESGDLLVKDGMIRKSKETRHIDRKHPAYQMWRDSVGLLKSLACEFGMTPSSRARLQLPAGPDPENPWTRF
jgi:P27 family predicted phage terminase small subunit